MKAVQILTSLALTLFSCGAWSQQTRLDVDQINQQIAKALTPLLAKNPDVAEVSLRFEPRETDFDGDRVGAHLSAVVKTASWTSAPSELAVRLVGHADNTSPDEKKLTLTFGFEVKTDVVPMIRELSASVKSSGHCTSKPATEGFESAVEEKVCDFLSAASRAKAMKNVFEASVELRRQVLSVADTYLAKYQEIVNDPQKSAEDRKWAELSLKSVIDLRTIVGAIDISAVDPQAGFKVRLAQSTISDKSKVQMRDLEFNVTAEQTDLQATIEVSNYPTPAYNDGKASALQFLQEIQDGNPQTTALLQNNVENYFFSFLRDYTHPQ